MDNFNVLYDDYSSSDDNSINSDNYDNKRDIIKDKYYNIIINSIDREWSNLYKNTFSFNIKFGNINENIGNNEYSSSISIPIVIKNIFNIEIYKIQLPSRFIDIGNNNFINITDLNGISLVIDELNNICYGSNSILNNSFGNFIPITPIPKQSIANFIELKNINPYGKFFYPAPLNTLNTLTFKMYDLDGMELKYDNDKLTIKKIEFDKVNNLIIITTHQDFLNSDNYKNDDILIFKNMKTNSNLLNVFLGNNNHKINSHSESVIKIKYNPNSPLGTFIKTDPTIGGGDLLGDILNKNLQLKLFMNIKTKEKEVLSNIELI